MPTKEWIRADLVATQALSDLSQDNPGRYMRQALTWCREAVRTIGYNGKFVHEVEVPVKEREIAKPNGFEELASIKLHFNDGGYIEPVIEAYSGHLEESLVKVPEPGGTVVIGQDYGCFFFIRGNPNSFRCATISYLGMRYDKDGILLIPSQAENAVKAYIDWKFTKRLRSRNRDIPEAEVAGKFAIWQRMCGDARGNLNTPSQYEAESEAYKHRINPVRGPRSRYR